jgi:hypothetical protein
VTDEQDDDAQRTGGWNDDHTRLTNRMTTPKERAERRRPTDGSAG